MKIPTEMPSNPCNCYAIWHSVGKTNGCIVSIRRRLDDKSIAIIRYLSYGMGYREVADVLVIPHSTCWYYIEKAMDVLRAGNIAALVATALRLGIIY